MKCHAQGAEEHINANKTFTEATSNNKDGIWVNDPARGIVLSATEGNRYQAGTQGIDLRDGFSRWLWVNVNSSNTHDSLILGGISFQCFPRDKAAASKI